MWDPVYPGQRSFLARPGLLSGHPYGISVQRAAIGKRVDWRFSEHRCYELCWKPFLRHFHLCLSEFICG
jgi:hypothetical protein